MNLTTTHKTRYRIGLFGRLILQVQDRIYVYSYPGFTEPVRLWRDAKISDFTYEKET